MQPLAGTLVVDFTRYLPGAYASRELLRLGARVVRVEPPEGDPLRHTAPGWDARLRAGTESVVCDLKAEPELARSLCSRADVVLEGFRPGVAVRLGIGPDDVPETAVYCSITGFGSEGRHAGRAGHDLNYLGWAGALEDTAPALPPIQVADLAAGALGAVTRVLAALLERERTGSRAADRRLDDARLARPREPSRRRRSGATDALGRARLLPRLRVRRRAAPDRRRARGEVLRAALRRSSGATDLASRQYDADQEALAAELADVFATRPLAEWLEHFGDEDVCVGPVATLTEAAAEFGVEPTGSVPALGEHTDAWRLELG